MNMSSGWVSFGILAIVSSPVVFWNYECTMSHYYIHISVQGVAIINLRKTWEKLLLAARVIAAVENPADICVLSHRPYGQVCKGYNLGLLLFVLYSV